MSATVQRARHIEACQRRETAADTEQRAWYALDSVARQHSDRKTYTRALAKRSLEYAEAVRAHGLARVAADAFEA